VPSDLVPPSSQVHVLPAPEIFQDKQIVEKNISSPISHDNRSPYMNRLNNEQQLPYQYAMEDKESRRNVYNREPVQSLGYEYDSLAPPNLGMSVYNPNNLQTKSTAKLPHGLTVQELKEMTKARLQAEASDKVREEPLPTTKEQYGTVPLTNLSAQDFQERSTDFSCQHASPLPPGFHGMRSSESSGRFIESREGMDSGSVSTSTSEYPHSESVYSGGLGNDDAMSAITFSRSGSLPGVPGLSYEWRSVGQEPDHTYIPSTPVQFYDRTGIIPGRRRAATLSPKPTSLFHAREDRPIFANSIAPMVPSVSTPQPKLPGQCSSDVQTSIQEPRSSFGHTLNFESGIGFANDNGFLANRSRTFSLPSSFQSNESLRTDLSSFGNHTPQRYLNQFEIVKEEIPSLVGLDSVFRDSPPVAFKNDFNDRLRESNVSSHGFSCNGGAVGNYAIRPPSRKRAETDFYTPIANRTDRIDDFPRAPGSCVDNRNRASTWDAGLGLFGSTTDLDANLLAADIASILKLSEADQKDHYFPPPGFGA
jgi:hypothetical protein